MSLSSKSYEEGSQDQDQSRAERPLLLRPDPHLKAQGGVTRPASAPSPGMPSLLGGCQWGAGSRYQFTSRSAQGGSVCTPGC